MPGPARHTMQISEVLLCIGLKHCYNFQAHMLWGTAFVSLGSVVVAFRNTEREVTILICDLQMRML